MKTTNYDVVEALQDIRQEILKVPIETSEPYDFNIFPRDINNYKYDILEIIDYKIREYTE